MPSAEGPQTLYDKIISDHIVDEKLDGTILIYIDRHLVHEVTSPQAFEGLKNAGRKVRRPDCTLATTDHNVPTTSRKDMKDIASFIKEEDSRLQCVTLEENVKDFGITYFGLGDRRQGIVHVIGPEQGFTLPGTTVVCGDSHTSTHGAFGCFATGIGTSEVEHVLATQCLVTKRNKNMRIQVEGELAAGVSSKDVVLHAIGRIGTAGGTGCVIEFCGSSREHAPWALLDFGIRCIIAPSFADIFFNNTFKNGMLPIAIPDKADLDRIAAEARAGRDIEVDLPAQVIRDASGSDICKFDVEEFRKYCLVNGLDDIGLTLQLDDKITEHERHITAEWPWIDGTGYLKRTRGGKLAVKPVPVPTTNRGEEIKDPIDW